MNKKKAGFIKGLVKVVRSHFYDLFTKAYEEGTENAKEKHNVDLPQGSVKEVIKDAIKRNKEAKPDWKATRAEVQEIINSGAKQAWAAVKNDKDGLKDSEDDFLSSLDLDLDDLNDEDWKDILGDDFNEEDMGMESLDEKIQAQFQGAKDYVEGAMNFDPPEEEESVVTGLTDNDITAAIMLFLANSKKCPEFVNHFKDNYDDICKLIEGCNDHEYPVDQIDSGSDSNLVRTKELIKNVNQEMVPVVGYGSAEQSGMESDDEEVDPVVTVVEEVPINEEEAYRMSQNRLEVISDIGNTISTIMNQIEDKATEEMHNIYSIWNFKIDRVARFCAALDGCSEDKYRKLFKEELFDVCGVCECVDISEEVCVYFYLGIVPSKYIDLGYRVCDAYLKVIE